MLPLAATSPPASLRTGHRQARFALEQAWKLLYMHAAPGKQTAKQRIRIAGHQLPVMDDCRLRWYGCCNNRQPVSWQGSKPFMITGSQRLRVFHKYYGLRLRGHIYRHDAGSIVFTSLQRIAPGINPLVILNAQRHHDRILAVGRQRQGEKSGCCGLVIPG